MRSVAVYFTGVRNFSFFFTFFSDFAINSGLMYCCRSLGHLLVVAGKEISLLSKPYFFFSLVVADLKLFCVFLTLA